MTVIQEVTVYRVLGVDFASIDKAKDHIDGRVNKLLQDALTPRGFTVSECVKVTDAVLSLRESLADLLLVELDC